MQRFGIEKLVRMREKEKVREKPKLVKNKEQKVFVSIYTFNQRIKQAQYCFFRISFVFLLLHRVHFDNGQKLLGSDAIIPYTVNEAFDFSLR